MLTANELDDPANARIRAYLHRFRAAAVPDPEHGRWETWMDLLRDRGYPANEGPSAAMNQDLPGGFGTVSSGLIAVPAFPGFGTELRWRHADGPPDKTTFLPVSL
jgi:hypothetical protein